MTRIHLKLKACLFLMPESNYYQGFDEKEAIKFALKYNGVIKFLYPTGSYILKGTPFITFYSETKLSAEDVSDLLDSIDLYIGQPVEKKSPIMGFNQLAEVAIKALSPGINDPETAVLSINALTKPFF